jgi:hypothetical protein
MGAVTICDIVTIVSDAEVQRAKFMSLSVRFFISFV